MAFESLTDKFKNIFKKIRGQSRLSEKNMQEMLQEVRIALFEEIGRASCRERL